LADILSALLLRPTVVPEVDDGGDNDDDNDEPAELLNDADRLSLEEYTANKSKGGHLAPFEIRMLTMSNEGAMSMARFPATIASADAVENGECS
jgi:hypothetical protein